jgi:hypothetical protein
MPMQNRIRWGIWALAISGVLFTVAALIPGVAVDPSTSPDAFARVSATVGFSNMLGIPAGAFLLVGVLTLYLFLAGTSVDRIAFAGLLLIIAGVSMFLPFIGIYAFAGPVSGRHYLNGDSNAVTIITESTSTTNPSALIFGSAAGLALVTGAVAIAIAIWRSKSLPRWSGITFAIAILFSADPFFFYQPIIWVSGGLLLLISGLWLSTSIRKASR